MELRYAYDAQGNPVGRQHVHLQGAADFFQYDAGDRLVRADMMANPTLGDMEGISMDGFQVPEQARGRLVLRALCARRYL